MLRTANAIPIDDADLAREIRDNRAYPMVRTAERGGHRFVVLRDPWLQDDADEPTNVAATPKPSTSSTTNDTVEGVGENGTKPRLLPRKSGRLDEDMLAQIVATEGIEEQEESTVSLCLFRFEFFDFFF